jgi:transcriptional antiterminator NusG
MSPDDDITPDDDEVMAEDDLTAFLELDDLDDDAEADEPLDFSSVDLEADEPSDDLFTLADDEEEEEEEEASAEPTEADPAPPTTGLVFDLDDDDLDDIEIDLDLGGDDAEEAESDLALDFGLDETPDEEEAAGPSEGDTAAAREALNAELDAKEGDWYVVHTYSGMEKRVKQNLDSRVKTLNMEEFIFETVVPTEDVVEIRNGQKKTVTRTVLPGYVLVRMYLTDDSWSAVRRTPSVTGFVGHANEPVSLSRDEVLDMLMPGVLAAQRSAEGAKAPRRKKVELVDFRVGDSVMLTDGPFTGVHATITEINVHSQRLKATLEFMGRDTPVDLTLDQVQKI